MGTGYDYSCPAAHTQCILCLQYLTLLSLHTITTVYFVSKVYCNLLHSTLVLCYHTNVKRVHTLLCMINHHSMHCRFIRQCPKSST